MKYEKDWNGRSIKMEELVLKFIVAPLLAVLGIYVVGTFIVAVIGIPGAVVSLFVAVGGFGYLANKFWS